MPWWRRAIWRYRTGVSRQAYVRRREIEIVMRYYRHACEFGTTRIHSNLPVTGSEFADLPATVLTFLLTIQHNNQESFNHRNPQP